MTLQLMIFIGAMIYLCWAFVRYWKRRNRKDIPFIEVVKDEPVHKPHREKKQKKKTESESDREWRRRVRAEIEDMTK